MGGDAMTLLEKAEAEKKIRECETREGGHNRAELVDLALAYAAGKITGTQAALALGITNSRTILSSALMSAIRRGDVRVEKIR